MTAQPTLNDVLANSSLIVTCGPGGVGKTTTAAALAIAAARMGRRVVVVTVDPARRLADALGLDMESRAHEPHQVSEATDGTGSLSALMQTPPSSGRRFAKCSSSSVNGVIG